LTRPPAVLVLGGTAEAVALARALADEARELRVVTSLAGVTRSPAAVAGELRSGGFGGAEGLARYLDSIGAVAVVDATHPFAVEISANARAACAARSVALLQLLRPPWKAVSGDRWHPVDDLHRAAGALARLGSRVFLSIGLRDLGPFAAVEGAWFLLRAVDPPRTAVTLPRHALVIDRGPFAFADELELLVGHRIEVVVTRNAGGEGARAKLDAARALGLPVVMVSQPAYPSGERVEDVAGAVAWLRARVPGAPGR